MIASTSTSRAFPTELGEHFEYFIGINLFEFQKRWSRFPSVLVQARQPCIVFSVVCLSSNLSRFIISSHGLESAKLLSRWERIVAVVCDNTADNTVTTINIKIWKRGCHGRLSNTFEFVFALVAWKARDVVFLFKVTFNQFFSDLFKIHDLKMYNFVFSNVGIANQNFMTHHGV